MDRLLLYWPTEPVLFRGKGIGEAWRNEFLRVAPYELTSDPTQADVAFFYSDSVLDKELVGKLPTVAYHWGYYHKRFLDIEYHRFVRSKMQLMAQCDFVLAPSYVTQYELYHFGIESIFLPAGVDENTLNIPHSTNKKQQIMFLSRLAEHKRLEMLIEAASLLQPKIPLLVSGPGDVSGYKTLAESLGVPITFCELTDTEKVQALAESMVLVHPSEYEGFSLPPLEALYLETPVIASDIPQHRHLLSNYALYFYTAQELADRLALVLNNYSEAQEIARAGSQFVKDNYTLKLASERLSNILHEAIRSFCGKKLRSDPALAIEWYDRDHRRDWVYKSQHAEEGWFNHWRLQKVLASITGKSVLDVGAASGVYTIALAKAGYDVTWFDHSAEALENFKRNCTKFNVKTKMKLGSALSLPFGDRSFDTVWLGEVLEHVEEPARAFTEAIRVARHRVIATTPIGNAHFDPMHLQHWTRESLSGLLQGYDATIEEVTGEGEEGCFFLSVFKR